MKLPDHPRIAVDPEICGGRPRIAGTRVRVTDVLAMLAEGVSEEAILADFPYVKIEDIRASLAYAATLAKEAGRPVSKAHGAATRIPPGTYTLKTLPPLSDGAKAILASVDAAVPSSAPRLKAATLRADGAPGITLEDEGVPGIPLFDEGLPGFDPGD